MNEKLAKLLKYQQVVKNRLESSVPAKHVSNPSTFKAFLTKELETVSKKIEALKLVAGGK